MGRPVIVADESAIVASNDERLHRYCPDLETWPESWSIEPRDIGPGERIVAYFKPFLLHLLNLGRSRKTVRKHRDNLWALGGEVIRELHEDPALRERGVEEVLMDMVDEEGGPLIISYHISEQEQRSFDSTCRRLHRFLEETLARPH